jgi:hypothetical protein
MEAITPAMKDVLLKYLCENCTPEGLCDPPWKLFMAGIGNTLTKDQVIAAMAQFVRIGLLQKFIDNGMNLEWIMNLEAVDYLHRGGFQMQETLLLSSVDQLLLEVDKLQFEVKQLEADSGKKLIPGMERIAAFSANILAFYQAFNSR